jgi:hypothetical protein
MNNSKILLYKNGIDKFIKIQNQEIINLQNLNEIDYLIGIIFLTKMNSYCKTNNILIHGYFIAYTIINLFNKIRNDNIHNNDVIHFYSYIAQNIEYLNSRIDITDKTRIKINNNFCNYIVEISKIFNSLNENNNIITKLKYFFYILLLSAKFIGTGNIDEPNLLIISEYYSNIINIYLILLSKNEIINKQELFNNYIDYKSKLRYSLIEIKLITKTIDEIIDYIDFNIMNKFND